VRKSTLGFIRGKHNRMSHSMIILASQAKSINQHKNTERRVLICNVNIYFNQQCINPLPLLFESLLPGQEDCVFSSGHLNLHAKPETGIPYREKKS
jgi:hypothetical protein